MKVSILVPIYRVENYIERCAVSILNQSYDDLEIIFVDDMSTDDSVLIARQTYEKYLYKNDHKCMKIVRLQVTHKIELY